MEEWKDIPGWEGLYQVSSEGRVRSLDREVPCGKLTRMSEGRVLSLSEGGRYNTITLQGKTLTIHRLVAGAFIPNTEGKPTIDHISRDKKDNRVCNLRWATHKELCDNRPTMGLSHDRVCATGEKYITIRENHPLRPYYLRIRPIGYYGYFKTLPEAIEARNNFITT